MIYFALAISILLSLALVWFVFDLRRKLDGGVKDEKLSAMLERLKVLGEQNDALRQEIDRKLHGMHQSSGEQFKQTLRTVQDISGQSIRQIADVSAQLTKLEETNKQVANFSQNLQDILKNPKQRGVLGEYYLETVLKNVLPPGLYQMQYAFKNGEIVDAAVFVDKKIVPIDSKFSLENYNRLVHAREEDKAALEKSFVGDLKMRIQETAKYIRPEENTMDFAFMFIPSEGIYYDLLTNQVGGEDNESLIQRAASKYKVIIVSPTSFLAYLQTVLQGLKALKIEESAKQIRDNVEKLGRHILAFEEYMKGLGNSMATSVNKYNAAYKELGKIDKDVARITESEREIEPLTLEKPQAE